MSTAVAERLTPSVIKSPPPCEVYLYKKKRSCDNPSAYRIRRECECGVKSTRYLCESCYFSLMTAGVHCHICLRKITDWTLA